MVTANLALARTFLESYSKLPRQQQKKVRELTERFSQDPTRSGLNFERFGEARDPKVRSLRVDKAYRLIVIQPERGATLLCVWVDHHDDAYDWARNRTFEVNPVSGVLQVYSVEEAEGALVSLKGEAEEQVEAPVEASRLFEGQDDEDLVLAGVPLPLLASVRAVVNDAELDALAPHLPEDVTDILYSIAAGFSLMEALEEASRPAEPKEVDTENFEAALEHPETQRLFHVVEGEAELEAILDAPLEKWRVFLHPSQRRLVRMDAKGPVRVLGGAGTGKTVVLMHRARHLVTRVFTEPGDRILVTTYTKTLAEDLRAHLDALCGVEAKRIEVRHLHSWAKSYYERQVGHRLRIAKEHDRREAMEAALSEANASGRPLSFYLEEWDQVVQPQNVHERDDYVRARRVGRGTRLGRRQRLEVWEVLVRYREQLELRRLMEWQGIVREASLMLTKSGSLPGYRAILADEVQDLTASDLGLLRAMIPIGRHPDLFLVGDAHQRIYGGPVRLSACGIEIRGRARRLKLNYRTTEQIRNQAIAVLEGLSIDDLDGGVDSLRGYRSLRTGPVPEVRHFDSGEEEEAAIIETLLRWSGEAPLESICVAARTNKLIKGRYSRLLKREGIDHSLLANDDASGTGVRLATMHRLKGLEFSRVLLVGVQDGNVPLELPREQLPDEASLLDHLQRERCLLYVAATRARDELSVIGYGEPSPLLGRPGETPS